MKTQILSNLTEEINNINMAQKNSMEQKYEVERLAENYADSILRFVRRKEDYMQCCGGMYYA